MKVNEQATSKENTVGHDTSITYAEIRKIILKVSLLFPPIWNSAYFLLRIGRYLLFRASANLKHFKPVVIV